MPGQQDQQQAGCLPPAAVNHQQLQHGEEGEVQQQVQQQEDRKQQQLQQEHIKEVEECPFGSIPRSTRLPQPPNKQTIPTWWVLVQPIDCAIGPE